MHENTDKVQPQIKKIAIIGAGNVASHLAQALSHHFHIAQIWSRNPDNAITLAQKIGNGATAVSSLCELDPDCDLYIISVVDDAIAAIVEQTRHIKTGIWVHTSGSTPMDMLMSKPNYGVIYPLQTFSKTKDIDFSTVPLLIEGSTDDVTHTLCDIARKTSDNVRIVNSEGRMRLHVAAVFACNFVNYMWIVADRLLHQEGLDITAIMPLLEETMIKIRHLTPLQAQTGPARRGDTKIMAKHAAMLQDPDRTTYEMISKLITDEYSLRPKEDKSAGI